MGIVGNSVQKGQMSNEMWCLCTILSYTLLNPSPYCTCIQHNYCLCFANFCGAIESKNLNIFMKGTFSTVITFLVKVTQYLACLELYFLDFFSGCKKKWQVGIFLNSTFACLFLIVREELLVLVSHRSWKNV